jgi:hypothetical protein
MKSNKDLTINEFLAAQNIKRAMAYFDSNPEWAKESLVVALKSLYN